MEISYWQSRWQNDKTGWHMQQVFPLLKEYWHRLNVSEESAVLVPLCGASLDLQWLAGQGYCVIGVEVSEIAIERIIQQSNETFNKSLKGSFVRYKSTAMQLWCGDFFKLQKQWLPVIDAVYDKAALIALPEAERTDYATHLQKLIEPHTQILINCFEYKQTEMNGPPFAVFSKEMHRLFGDRFAIELLHTRSLFDEMINFHRRGLRSYLDEKIYHLHSASAK